MALNHYLMTEWISVKDRLPKEDVPVLVYDGKSIAHAHLCIYSDNTTGWVSEGSGYDADFDYDYYEWDTSHWMPLPEPPQAPEEQSTK